jgi:hypothetical protein
MSNRLFGILFLLLLRMMFIMMKRFFATGSIAFFLIIIGCDNSDNLVPVDSTIVPNSFLSEKTYDKLNLEIQPMSGFEPTAETITTLKTFLQQRLNKSGGITISMSTAPTQGLASYSISDIKSIENAHRTAKTTGKTLTAYILFLDGDYSANEGNAKVLGVAYGNTSMAIFEKTIRSFSGGVTQPPVKTLESTVILHEVGHILGLVNNGTPMQTTHQDATNGRHCTDQNCLMYYAAETSDIIANIAGGTIPSLDTNCLNDLKANGGK